MAYEKTQWKDHVVQYPKRFNATEQEDGSWSLTPNFGNVVQQGTPVSAANLNKIEDELKTLETDCGSRARSSRVKDLERKVDALWKHGEGIEYQFEEYGGKFYEGWIPSGAKSGGIQKLCGNCMAYNQLFPDNAMYKNTETDTADKLKAALIVHNYEDDTHYTMFAEEVATSMDSFRKIFTATTRGQTVELVHYTESGNSIQITGEKTCRIISGHKYYIRFYIARKKPNEVNGIRISYINLIDLTLMGIPNATTEDVAKIFPDKWYAQNAGKLVSAEVDKINVSGKNLVRKWDANGTWVTINDMNSGDYLMEPGTYTLRIDDGETTCHLYLHTMNTLIMKAFTGAYTFTCNEMFRPEMYITSAFEKIMLERADSATAYEDYYKHEFAIPAELIAKCPGYGLGVGSARNWIDFENGVYHREVAKVDLGTLTYIKNSLYRTFISGAISDAKAGDIYTTANILSGRFAPDTYYRTSTNASDDMISLNGNKQIGIYASQYYSMSVDEFQTAMNGVELVYELATPEEIDISEYISGFVFPCDGNGRIEYHQSSNRVPVFNIVDYTVRISEVANG